MGIYIFCDNSNLFIEGQWAAGRAEGLKAPNYELRIDYGSLLTLCSEGREIKQANLYGSVPPQNDSLWNAMKAHGWNVSTINRNQADKEKGLDIKIALDIQKTCFKITPPETIVLLAGDGDYQTLIEEVRNEHGWSFEIWFYSNVAGSLKALADRYVNLEDHLHKIRMK